MSAIKKTTISLPAEIKAAVAAGEFANAREAVFEALRRWNCSRTVIALGDEELRGFVTEGRKSGEPVEGEAALSLPARQVRGPIRRRRSVNACRLKPKATDDLEAIGDSIGVDSLGRELSNIDEMLTIHARIAKRPRSFNGATTPPLGLEEAWQGGAISATMRERYVQG